MGARAGKAIAAVVLALVAAGCTDAAPSTGWSTTEARLPVVVRGGGDAWSIPPDGLQCEIHAHPELGYTVQVGVIGPDDILEFVGPGYGLGTVTVGDGSTERRTPFFDNGTDGADGTEPATRFPVEPGTGTRGWWYLVDTGSGEIVSLEDRPTTCRVDLEVFTTSEAVDWQEEA